MGLVENLDTKLKKMEDQGYFEKKYDYFKAKDSVKVSSPSDFLTEQLKNELYFEQYEFLSYKPNVKYVSKFLDNILVKLDNDNLNLVEVEKIYKYVDTEFDENIYSKELEDSIKEELAALIALYFAFQEKLTKTKLSSKAKKRILDFENDSVLGYKFKEMIEQSKINSRAKIKSIIKANWAIKNTTYKDELRKASIDKINRDLDSITQTYNKFLREKTLLEDELNKDIEGWISIAVLDNRTTPICIKLDKKFYSKEKYEVRENIPNLPPRHIKCRSIVVRTKNYKNDARYADLSFSDLIREDEYLGIEVLGEKKYNLFKAGRYDIKDFISSENKFYTLKELEDKLNK